MSASTEAFARFVQKHASEGEPGACLLADFASSRDDFGYAGVRSWGDLQSRLQGASATRVEVAVAGNVWHAFVNRNVGSHGNSSPEAA